MGLFALLRRLFSGRPADPAGSPAQVSGNSAATGTPSTSGGSQRVAKSPLTPPAKLRYQSSLVRTPRERERCDSPEPPYHFAQRDLHSKYLNLATDGDARWLDYYGLPHFQTPAELARWLELPLGKVAWLTYRFCENQRPQSAREAHYHFRWLRKRSGGHRLIESPKKEMRRVQQMILREIVGKIRAHESAHGFVPGRSIITNAKPHVGRRVILKFDLDSFYTSVRYSRVVAIFRSLGYSREAALWLARLTTSSAPGSLKLPLGESSTIWKYMPRHLPQGASTSPALANLSAYALDVRLTGLARAWHVTYTRYADDLTFSASGKLIPALHQFIALVERIVRDEGFRIKRTKRKVLRSNQRQIVAGVVVNNKVNVDRREFDRLKATLHNCVKLGPATQNHSEIADFAGHLRGRVAHVLQLNPQRGAKLLALYQKIRWDH
jgi:RNA-directed DNA polymerase